jgi:iron(III) transport system ATP-binding protein
VSAPKGVLLRGVTKTYTGAVRALDGVDLTVAPGEFFTLLGPSGCGKTTLLRTIAGFERQDAGHVTIGGQAVDGVPPQRRNLGVVFQSHAVFPHLDVFENVAFGLRARGVSQAEVERRVAAALERVRLTGLGARTPDALSGGQQQRVGLARALVIEPDVLLMDEPLSSLDARLRLDMRDELRARQRALGITTIYVTHDQEEALAVSDRVAVMAAGRIAQVGTPWEVYGDPATQGVASFVGRVTVLGEDDARALGLKPPPGGSVAVRPEHVRLSPLAPGKTPVPSKPLATVGQAAFTGPLVTYPVTCGGVTLLAEEHRPGAVLLTPGTTVMLTIEPHHALRFDRDGARVLP